MKNIVENTTPQADTGWRIPGVTRPLEYMQYKDRELTVERFQKISNAWENGSEVIGNTKRSDYLKGIYNSDISNIMQDPNENPLNGRDLLLVLLENILKRKQEIAELRYTVPANSSPIPEMQENLQNTLVFNQEQKEGDKKIIDNHLKPLLFDYKALMEKDPKISKCHIEIAAQIHEIGKQYDEEVTLDVIKKAYGKTDGNLGRDEISYTLVKPYLDLASQSSWKELNQKLQKVRDNISDDYYRYISENTSIKSSETNQKNLLLYAVGSGQIDAINLLQSFNADFRVVDKNGQTALHSAAASGNKKLFDIVFENTPTEVFFVKDSKDRIPFDLLSKSFSKEIRDKVAQKTEEAVNKALQR